MDFSNNNLIPIFLGSALTIVAFLSFFINSFVIFIFIKSNLINPSTSSSFYILSFSNILGKIIFASCYLFYLGPSSIAQDFLFLDGKENIFYKFLGFLCHVLWGQDMVMEAIIALNRLLIIVYPKTQSIFTYNKTIVIALSSFFIGILCAIIGDLLLPCCPIYMNYKAFSQTFYVTSFNYSSFYIYLPLNAICSLIAGISYIWLYIHIRLTRKKTISIMPKSMQEKRKLQEIKYAIQFSFVTIWGIVTWSAIRICGFVIPKSEHPLSSIVSFLVLIHISANATVLLLLNNDVKNRFSNIFLKNNSHLIHPTITTIVQTH